VHPNSHALMVADTPSLYTTPAMLRALRASRLLLVLVWELCDTCQARRELILRPSRGRSLDEFAMRLAENIDHANGNPGYIQVPAGR